jgi:hypothetical protein
METQWLEDRFVSACIGIGIAVASAKTIATQCCCPRYSRGNEARWKAEQTSNQLELAYDIGRNYEPGSAVVLESLTDGQLPSTMAVFGIEISQQGESHLCK